MRPLLMLLACALAQEAQQPEPEPQPATDEPQGPGLMLGSPPEDVPPVEEIEADLDEVREELAESAEKLDALIKLMEERIAEEEPEAVPAESER